MKTALILVDIQNDYFPGGKMALEGSIQAGEQAYCLLSYFRQERLPLIHIQHISTRPGATFFLPETDGVKIYDKVQPLDGEICFQKHYPNSFRETPLLAYLQYQQINRLVVCGMMTHMCIDTTTRAAYDLGFECLLAQDACATKTLTYLGQSIPALSVQLSFLAALNGTFAKVQSSDDIIAGMCA